MTKVQTTIIFDNDVLDRLDAMCVAERRSRGSQLSYMIDGWPALLKASLEPRSAVATGGRPAKPKDETPLPGADGNLPYMMTIDPRTERPGSKFLLTWPDHLPLTYMETMPWAYRPPVPVERIRTGKLKNPEDKPPVTPEFIVQPTDYADISTPLRIFKQAYVATDHRASTPKTLMWVKHNWNEAMRLWVADPEDIENLSRSTAAQFKRYAVPDGWMKHHAYGATLVSQLKELLTALADDFNLTDDAKAFIGAGDEENEVA